jgi:hypothetical protein
MGAFVIAQSRFMFDAGDVFGEKDFLEQSLRINVSNFIQYQHHCYNARIFLSTKTIGCNWQISASSFHT